MENHFSKINEIFKDYYELESQLITKDNEDIKEDYIDDYNYSFNSDSKDILGSSYTKYLENLYSNIPKYLTNYEIKDNKFLFNNQNFYGYINKEEKTKNQNNNVYISYNDIINNCPSLNFLSNHEEIIFDLNFYSSITHIENKEYKLALE